MLLWPLFVNQGLYNHTVCLSKYSKKIVPAIFHDLVKVKVKVKCISLPLVFTFASFLTVS